MSANERGPRAPGDMGANGVPEMTTATTAIKTELARLHASSIVVHADDDLPEGWVGLSDDDGSVYGPATEILTALEEVEFDPAATVETDGEPLECLDRKCPHWHGEEPEAGSPHDHGHETTETVARDNGWELAWEALSQFGENAPTNSRDWPDELIETEALEEGGPNDEPNTLIIVRTNAGTRFAAGPHGVYTCALSETFQHGSLAVTREEALAGVEICE